MKIAAVCVTYNRPELLPRLLRCFFDQDWPDKELLILDDLGQYEPYTSKAGWRVVSFPHRFRTLGEKRNAAMALTSPDVEAFAPWDDDDLFFPWALRACAEALKDAELCQSHEVLEDRDGRLFRYKTFGAARPDRFAYHCSWAYRRSLMEKTGGYPIVNQGEDQDLDVKWKREMGIESVNIQTLPFYVYNRTAPMRMSDQVDAVAYEAVTAEPPKKRITLIPSTEPLPWGVEDIPQEVHPRPF
jgi:glycosyltransferase involved in cell wall biosynthesis